MQIRPLVSRKVHFLSDAPPSLQRVLLTTQPYDFEIKYIPGKRLHLQMLLTESTLKIGWK